VILDVWLGDSDRDGLKILDLIKRDHPYVPVIMISGHGTIETAVSAIKKGAYDFIEKPFQMERLLILVQRAIESSMLKMENESLRKKAGPSLALYGQTSIITSLKNNLEKTAPTNSRIFFKGPVGSEKESIAKFIHDHSKRAKAPFHTFNCSTIHPQFIEAELFGTEITGLSIDQPRKIGVVEQCHTGTLYIEHIDEMPLPIQAKLLKVLQENAFQRVGSPDKITVDIRFIAGSSKIDQALLDGNFREDLFYRLAVSIFDIPGLKDRVVDIPYLVKHLMEDQAATHGVAVRKFSEDALAILQSYGWPGNLKQLKNTIEWVLINADSSNKEAVVIQELPADIVNNNNVAAAWNKSAEIVVLPLREAREAFERDYLVAQVNRFGGNISQTARFIGMERSALHRKLRALGVYDGKDDAKADDSKIA
jgi:two-component system nitrogen regulation response regulator NtrX